MLEKNPDPKYEKWLKILEKIEIAAQALKNKENDSEQAEVRKSK